MPPGLSEQHRSVPAYLGAVSGALLCGGISGDRRSGDIDAVVTETGQRTAERRASCGDGPTHRGIPGDHLVGTPFGGWGPGTMLGLPRPLHPGTFAPRPHPYILLYIVLTGRCRVQRVQKVILPNNP